MYNQLLAWKDEDYRELVGADLDGHPAGLIDLSVLRDYTPESTTPTKTDCPSHSCVDPGSVCAICTTLHCMEETFDAINF